MARTSRRKFEDIDEKALVGITRIKSQHSFIDIFLSALALVTGSQKSASRIRSQASFQSGSLGVVMSVVDNDSPVSVNVSGTFRHGVQDFRGTQVTFGPNPVRNIIWTRSLGGPSVIFVIKASFHVLVQMFNQIVGRLICYIAVFFLKKVVSRNGIFDLILGVVRVFKTIMKTSGVGTVRRKLGVTIPSLVMRCSSVMGNGRRVMVGCVGSVIRAGTWEVGSWGWVVARGRG